MPPPLLAIKNEKAATITSNDFCIETPMGGGSWSESSQWAGCISRTMAPFDAPSAEISGRWSRNWRDENKSGRGLRDHQACCASVQAELPPNPEPLISSTYYRKLDKIT
jgi:hypothetical protein